MSDEAVHDEERLWAARKKIVEACAEYADSWSTTEGGIVVSFVAGFEVMSPDGGIRLVESCGSGAEGEASLAVWRRAGILHDLLFGNRLSAP